MWWLYALLILIALGGYVFVYVIERENAREQADEYITGTRLHAPAEIDQCIRRLDTANHRLLSKNEADRGRMAQLYRI
ncbi:unnamed protein product, partial [marine sediment metagenome]